MKQILSLFVDGNDRRFEVEFLRVQHYPFLWLHHSLMPSHVKNRRLTAR